MSETPNSKLQTPKTEYLQYGGQAIIEGVMMRSPKFFAVACRAPNGKIILQAEPLSKTWVGRQKWLKAPFLRGTLALLDAMALGIRALQFSSEVQMDPKYLDPEDPDHHPTETEMVVEETAASLSAGYAPVTLIPEREPRTGDVPQEEDRQQATAREQQPRRSVHMTDPSHPESKVELHMEHRDYVPPRIEEEPVDASEDSTESTETSVEGSEILRPQAQGGSSLQKMAVIGAMVTGLAFGVGLFVVSPVLLAELFTWAGITNQITLNIFEGIIKAAIFIGYIALIGRMEAINEVFKYHGAEHKAINALEAGEDLNLENAKAQTRLHPRCGTSFAIIVLLISIVLFTFLPRDYQTGIVIVDLFVRIGLKLLILPFIAGIGYEAIRIAGKFRSEKWVQALFWPGLKSQYLTTREPEDEHVEVALVALRAVLDQEERAKAAEESPASTLA